MRSIFYRIEVEYYDTKEKAENFFPYPCVSSSTPVKTKKELDERLNDEIERAKDSSYNFVNVSVLVYEPDGTTIQRVVVAAPCKPRKHYYYCFGWNDMSASADYREVDETTARRYQEEINNGTRDGYITNSLSSALYHCQN